MELNKLTPRQALIYDALIPPGMPVRGKELARRTRISERDLRAERKAMQEMARQSSSQEVRGSQRWLKSKITPLILREQLGSLSPRAYMQQRVSLAVIGFLQKIIAA